MLFLLCLKACILLGRTGLSCIVISQTVFGHRQLHACNVPGVPLASLYGLHSIQLGVSFSCKTASTCCAQQPHSMHPDSCNRWHSTTLSAVKGDSVATGQTQWTRPDAGMQAAFMPSTTFSGPRAGYAFKLGPSGLGYYKDSLPSSSAAANTGEPPQAATGCSPHLLTWRHVCVPVMTNGQFVHVHL